MWAFNSSIAVNPAPFSSRWEGILQAALSLFRPFGAASENDEEEFEKAAEQPELPSAQRTSFTWRIQISRFARKAPGRRSSRQKRSTPAANRAFRPRWSLHRRGADFTGR